MPNRSAMVDQNLDAADTDNPHLTVRDRAGLTSSDLRFTEGLEWETGCDPSSACLEGIWLEAVWQRERPGEQKLSGYHLGDERDICQPLAEEDV